MRQYGAVILDVVDQCPGAIETTEVGGVTIKTTSNPIMHNYLSVTDHDPPFVTWRIGNRTVWDGFEA